MSRHARPQHFSAVALLGVAAVVCGVAALITPNSYGASPGQTLLMTFQGTDHDCSDFPSAEAAWDYWDHMNYSKTKDPERLDADHDGIACEDLPRDYNYVSKYHTNLKETSAPTRGSAPVSRTHTRFDVPK